ncbi:hypothetical protein OH76DRAFT_1405029 [Lentinus brumalis]|uniref:Uncharacterized protein n=1 Tax=Lentinus brumalis TaxID=2498619 RepID=A0A371D6E9_9APHY|nr:hypothetical protein OH76DRAFT_1405029 [Polyporus brumalis]
MTSTYAPLKPISNGPKATHPLNAAPPAAGSTKASTPDVRFCSQCRRTLSPSTVYKWCEVCRLKDREKAKRKKQRALELAAQVHAAASSVPVTPDARSVAINLDGDDTDVEMQGPGAVVYMHTKRKACEMESDTLGAVPSQHATSETEYQTEGLFTDALSQRMRDSRASSSTVSAPSYVEFFGSYTIVMDPNVSAVRRAKRTKADLMKSAHLQFGDLIKYESTTRNMSHARTYWCACNPAPTPPAILAQHPASQPHATFASTPSSTPPTIKRTQSTLTSWLSKPAPPSGMHVSRPADPVKVPTPPPGCGGTITVSVVEDASHPLASMGIKGQRIAVRVEHPGRDVNKSFAFEH